MLQLGGELEQRQAHIEVEHTRGRDQLGALVPVPLLDGELTVPRLEQWLEHGKLSIEVLAAQGGGTNHVQRVGVPQLPEPSRMKGQTRRC